MPERLLARLSRAVTQIYDRHLAAVGLKTSQFAMLRAIERLQPINVTNLARDMRMERSTLARNLQPLARLGFAILSTDPEDHRSRSVRLTEAGQTKLGEGQPYWLSAQNAFEQAFGQSKTRALHSIMKAVATVVVA